ncbi:choline ethanolaminephosphotransferase [Cyathus striatus]|nr:choline ethanolaminephosphotransferase [Cyathus striatus]
MGYVPQKSLENLKKYSYKGVDKSLLSRNVLNPFWNWFVTLWPLNVAPNTITLTGLSIVFLNFLTLLYYDPLYLVEKDDQHNPPNWVYFTWAAGLFLYQTLDAIDGKQARRTGMAGPLGEMFDHGCDAINTTLEAVLACRAMGLGRSWWTVASQIATLANFYLTTWEEYHTGQLFLGYFSGPVEGIIMIVIIYAITGVYGPTFWDQRIWTVTHIQHLSWIQKLPNIRLNEAFMVFGAIGLGFNICIGIYANVRKAVKANKNQIINSASFVPFLCAWGLQFAHQVGRMILAHVTSGPFPMWDWVWIWSVIGAVDANLPRVFGIPPIIQSSIRNTTFFVWITLLVSFFAYARFCTLVIKDITNFLGIACFTVRKKDEKGVWKRTIVDEKSS